VHEAAPVTEVKPAEHGTHSDAPAAEYVPMEQLVHQKDALAPSILEKVPAGQLAQVFDPGAEENIPFGQSVQLGLKVPVSENWPAKQLCP